MPSNDFQSVPPLQCKNKKGHFINQEQYCNISRVQILNCVCVNIHMPLDLSIHDAKKRGRAFFAIVFHVKCMSIENILEHNGHMH